MSNYKPFAQLTKEELMVMYEQWQVFMERRKAQLDRAKRQREENRDAKAYALEHGYIPKEV